jgi:CheY-like chemotaxis protein
MPAAVLVVHDERNTRELAVSALRAAFLEAVGFADPMAALDAIQASSHVRVLVTRVMFGPDKLNGIALARMVRVKRPSSSLNARQKLLRFGQRQTQVPDIAKTFRPVDLYQVGAQAAVIIAGRKQPQHPSHSRSPSRLSPRPIVPLVASSPHSLDTPAPGSVAVRSYG